MSCINTHHDITEMATFSHITYFECVETKQKIFIVQLYKKSHGIKNLGFKE